MKILKYSILFLSLAFIQSCTIEDIPNPNGPSIEGVLVDATKSQLQTLVTGSENTLRSEIGFYYDVTAIIGREYYFFTGSDPRYTGEILGKGESTLDNAGFYGTRPYAGRYRTIRNLNVLIESAQNSTLLTDEELEGFLGFAETFKAYELLLVANMQFTNGVRVDVDDFDNLGDFVSYDEALSSVLDLLDEAESHLGNAGSSFPFNLSSGLSGFSDPASFLSFNRAVSARVALYQGNSSDALARVSESFIDEMGAMDMGPARPYSAAGGDQANPLFRLTDQADGIIAHPSFVEDLESGDNRADKIALRPSGELSLDDLSGTHDVVIYKSFEDNIPYITNTELLLIRAEANIGTDNAAAVADINVVRNAADLGDFSGSSDEEITAELINQRRYALFGLGHRWVDMRRWGMLDQLPIDRDGDDVWELFPRPVSEPQ